MMPALFTDRTDAGRQLAAKLAHLAGRSDVLVLGLPRGGVPVAYEVALALGAPLDVFVVRKLGVPGQEELAMGAVASGGVRVVNQEIVRAAGVTRHAFDLVTEAERHEIDRQEREFRDGRPFPGLRGSTVVLVDDGVATGSTMLAGVRALRELHPASIIAAAPVMAREAHRTLSQEADACECVLVPEPFRAVGQYYDDFEQTSDDRVRRLLRVAAARRSGEQARYAGLS
jgi:predicted phosphoribosyltransferase